MNSDKNLLQYQIVQFEGKFATLQNEIYGIIKWPIKKLPESIEIGSQVVLGVIENNLQDLTDEQMKLLLTELIN